VPRPIPAKLIADTARELMARAAIDIPADYRDGVRRARERERNRIARFVLTEMERNWDIATAERRPMCADSVQTLTNVNFHCSPAATVRPDGTHAVEAVTAPASFRFGKSMSRWTERLTCASRRSTGAPAVRDRTVRRDHRPDRRDRLTVPAARREQRFHTVLTIGCDSSPTMTPDTTRLHPSKEAGEKATMKDDKMMKEDDTMMMEKKQ
jgi:hypothetical protein